MSELIDAAFISCGAEGTEKFGSTAWSVSIYSYIVTILCGGADKFVTPDPGTNFSEG